MTHRTIKKENTDSVHLCNRDVDLTASKQEKGIKADTRETGVRKRDLTLPKASACPCGVILK